MEAAIPAIKQLQTHQYTYLVADMTPAVDELLDTGKWNLVPTEIVSIQEHELLVIIDYTLLARICNRLSSK